MSQLYLGIDPGIGGGLAILDEKGQVILAGKFFSWPDVQRRIWAYCGAIKGCCIEKVASKSAQGVKSVFTFGMNYGGWLCYLETRKIPHVLVPPVRWQRKFLGSFPSGESKQRSLDYVRRRFPDVTLKKSDHGVSDAILLALYAIVLDRSTTAKLRSDKKC